MEQREKKVASHARGGGRRFSRAPLKLVSMDTHHLPSLALVKFEVIKSDRVEVFYCVMSVASTQIVASRIKYLAYAPNFLSELNVGFVLRQ